MTGSTRNTDNCGRLSHISERRFGAIDVALFLPFGRNKEQQMAASGGAKRSSKIVEFYERLCAIRHGPAHDRKGRLTFLFPPVNRRVAGLHPKRERRVFESSLRSHSLGPF